MFQVQNCQILRTKQLFYENCADVTFKFNDGTKIRANKVILAIHSLKFHQFFIESSEDVLEIQDFDVNAFKLFLDCLIGFQKCSPIDALLIFPIAWKYEAEELIKQCIDILSPTVLNENVCLALNISLFCKCEELIEIIKTFLLDKVLINKLLNDEKLYFLLEPESMEMILRYVEMDSYVLKNVFEWGDQYLKKNNKICNLKDFFEELNFVKFFDISLFETMTSFLEFDKSELGKNFYTDKQFRDWVVDEEIDKRKSAWFNVKGGEVLVEKVKIKDVLFQENFVTRFYIHSNREVYYELPNDVKEIMIEYQYSFNFCDSQNGIKKFNRVRLLKNIKGTSYAYLEINIKLNTILDLELEINRKFNFDCRIIKKSPKSFLSVDGDEEELYFTDLIEITHKKNMI